MSTPTKILASVSLIIIVAVILAVRIIVPTEAPDDASTFLDDVIGMNDLAKQWLFSNVREKGLFVYSLDPATGEVSEKNNAIRQLMASRVLAAESHTDETLLELHQRNLDFVMEYWYRETAGEGYVYYDDKSKLGANAMLLRTLVASPLLLDYQDEAAALVRGILALQHDDGSFSAWYREPDYEYDEDYLLTFYSGEALLALTEYHQAIGYDGLLESIEKSASYYVDLYASDLEENYYPAYVPWHTMAYRYLFPMTGDNRYADAIFILNDKLLELQDTSDQVGRFYNPDTPEYGNPHASSDAVYTEGLAYAYEVAVMVDDKEHADRYQEAIELSLQNLMSLQYREEIKSEMEPEDYLGAIRIREDSSWIRVDTAQHAIDAFDQILRVF